MEIFGLSRNKQYILGGLLFLVIALFVVLLKFNPGFLASIPGLSQIIPKSFYSVTPDTPASTDNSHPTSFSVGANHGESSLRPVSGSVLLPAGAYNDGDYSGFSSTTSGPFVIKITISKGALTDISFITLPQDAPQSVLDTLAREAISNQIVEVSPVNGYDEISSAFKNALANAIQKAFKQ